MLPNTQEMIQMCSFDANKSTKGASKLRRDLINAEIANLRDLLPLPSSTRQRLSQLQLMALVCVYVRKANYFQQVFRKYDIGDITTPNIGFSKALSGFLLMMTQNGKLLYISDNAAEYLGHSMEDLLIHGDSVYDIIDKQDHQAVQTELTRSTIMPTTDDERIFLCRMNVSRNARRQMRFGDQKVVLMQGHFLSFLPLCSRNEPVFLGTCTPVAMPETRECVVQGSTNIFTSIHTMDMKFIHLDKNGEFHLGYTKEGIQGTSWYQLIHWDNIKEAQGKHRIITQTDQERACILLLRLQVRSGSWLWLHVVLQVKDNMEGSQYPVIVCTNQVLSEKEATVMRANNWLYHYYTVQSKLQYSLALQESHAAAAAAAAAATAAARMQPTYYHHQTLMAYPPHHHHHHHLQQPETHLHPHLIHHHHHEQQLGTSSSLNGSQHHSSSTATSSHYSAYGTSDSSSYHYYHAPTGTAMDCTTNQSPPTSPSTNYPRLTSLAPWMPPATPPDLASGSSPVSPIWLNRGLSYDDPQQSSSANTKEPNGTQPANNVRPESPGPSLTSIGHEHNGVSSGTVQLLSSPAIVPPASRTMRAKYERKLRQLSGRTLHRETYGGVSEDDDDSIRTCREDLMSTIPSPSHSDPQTVPDLAAAVIVSGQLGAMEVFRSATEQQHIGLSRSNTNDIAREESYLPHWTTMDNREVAMEQYVPDMIRRRSEDDSFATSEFYTWNGVNNNYRTLLQGSSPEFDLRKSFYHMTNNYQRHVQSLTSLVSTSDGETASLHTSPSPSYSLDGSPEFAFPHTPDSWPSILPFGVSSRTLSTDGMSGDEDLCGLRKKRKLSASNYGCNRAKDDICMKTSSSERSNGAITDSVTNSNGGSGRRGQCLCNANTCSPHCPCLKVMQQGQTMKNVPSKTWKHCCSLKVDICKRNTDNILDFYRSYGCNESERSVLVPQTFKVELKSDVDKNNRDAKGDNLDDHKTHHHH